MDSTYFGKYHSLIEGLGYKEKQEQKGFQIQLEVKPNQEQIPVPRYNEGDSRMVFRNAEFNSAILITNNYISFHKLAPYESWESMLEKQIIPGLKKYKELGLGNDLIFAQMLYLNQYELKLDQNISDFFNYISAIENFGIGNERSLFLQSQYDLDPNLMSQIKLNANVINERKQIFLECSCIAFNKGKEEDVLSIARLAHDQNNLVFNKICK